MRSAPSALAAQHPLRYLALLAAEGYAVAEHFSNFGREVGDILPGFHLAQGFLGCLCQLLRLSAVLQFEHQSRSLATAVGCR